MSRSPIMVFHANRSRHRHITSFQVISLGFLSVILLGSLLLMMPIATKSGQCTSFLDALFTATSAVCVTGLVVNDTATYWSLFVLNGRKKFVLKLRLCKDEQKSEIFCSSFESTCYRIPSNIKLTFRTFTVFSPKTPKNLLSVHFSIA